MFDPNLPQAGTEIDAVEMRAQLTGLKALIDAIPTPDVTQVDLNNAIETTARNCDSVDPVNMVSSDADLQTLADKLDELINALPRN